MIWITTGNWYIWLNNREKYSTLKDLIWSITSSYFVKWSGPKVHKEQSHLIIVTYHFFVEFIDNEKSFFEHLEITSLEFIELNIESTVFSLNVFLIDHSYLSNPTWSHSTNRLAGSCLYSSFVVDTNMVNYVILFCQTGN